MFRFLAPSYILEDVDTQPLEDHTEEKHLRGVPSSAELCSEVSLCWNNSGLRNSSFRLGSNTDGIRQSMGFFDYSFWRSEDL